MELEYIETMNKDLEVLLQRGAKLTRRGLLVRPTFLRLGLELSPHFLECLKHVELLDVQVKIDDILDYSLLEGTHINDLLEATGRDFEKVLNKLEMMCEKGRVARNKRLGLS